MEKFTSWFEHSVKPVRTGWYQTRLPTYPICYSFWDGEHWSFSLLKPLTSSESLGIGIQQKKWRGLIKQEI